VPAREGNPGVTEILIKEEAEVVLKNEKEQRKGGKR
jgi:hypothetical protein